MARDGSTLTADPGGWNGTPSITYEYQWQRCDAAGGELRRHPGRDRLRPTRRRPADVGGTVRVLVTAVNDAGSSAPAASAVERDRQPAGAVHPHHAADRAGPSATAPR